MPAPSPLEDHLFMVHEDRIERLESVVMDSSKQLAEVSATLKHFESKMDTQMNHIGGKIDTLAEGMVKQDEKISSISKRVEQVEVDAKAKGIWWEMFQKVLLYAITAGAGGVVAMLIQRLM